jgi:hypothetical protein
MLPVNHCHVSESRPYIAKLEPSQSTDINKHGSDDDHMIPKH